MIPEQTAELVRLRLEQAQSTLNDAVVLAEGGGTPKSIINRAYYAMFYAVLALLQSIGKAAGKHTGAIGLFDTEFVLKGVFSRELSRDLHKAFDSRQVSDYQPVRPATSEEAKEYISKARGSLVRSKRISRRILQPEAEGLSAGRGQCRVARCSDSPSGCGLPLTAGR